mmetsp:Transcript_11708/g.28844  ORF Transcript_11708/g.28844 Transcript_11708/m.28844 type:complete len:413 (-) Transcript_11708:89-1327(-)
MNCKSFMDGSKRRVRTYGTFEGFYPKRALSPVFGRYVVLGCLVVYGLTSLKSKTPILKQTEIVLEDCTNTACCQLQFPGNPMIGQMSMFDQSCPFGTPLDGGVDCIGGSKCRWCCQAPLDVRCGNSEFICPPNQHSTRSNVGQTRNSTSSKKHTSPTHSKRHTLPSGERVPNQGRRDQNSTLPKTSLKQQHKNNRFPSEKESNPSSVESNSTTGQQGRSHTATQAKSHIKPSVTSQKSPTNNGDTSANSSLEHKKRSLRRKNFEESHGKFDSPTSRFPPDKEERAGFASMVVAFVILGSLVLAIFVSCCERHFRQRRQCCCCSVQFSFRRNMSCVSQTGCCKMCCFEFGKKESFTKQESASPSGDPCKPVAQAVNIGKDMVGFLLVDSPSSALVDENIDDSQPGAFDPQFFG